MTALCLIIPDTLFHLRYIQYSIIICVNTSYVTWIMYWPIVLEFLRSKIGFIHTYIELCKICINIKMFFARYIKIIHDQSIFRTLIDVLVIGKKICLTLIVDSRAIPYLTSDHRFNRTHKFLKERRDYNFLNKISVPIFLIL